MNKEKRKEYNHNYYIKNKEKLLKQHKEWMKAHRKQETQRIINIRRKRVEKLREQGISNAWNVVLKGAKPKYEIKYYEKEIERLNKIIDELEKWAKEELEQPNWASCGARCMLDKLKELKEGK